MTMSYFHIDTYPTVASVTPWVSNGRIIGEYGVDENDNIIEGACAPRYRPLPPGPLPTIKYDHDLMFDAYNPIDRGKFEIPPTNGQLYIISNRHIMRDLLNCFLFSPSPHLKYDAHHDIAPFEVHRIENRIYFGSLSPRIGPKEYVEEDSRKNYGIPFEKIVTTCITSELNAFYRFNSFTLLNSVNLIVRAEIDCVDEKGHYYEIKARRFHNPKFSPLEDAVLMRDYWGQMFLGLAHSLVLGLYFELAEEEEAELLGVQVLPAEEVQQLAEVPGLSMERFASLLRWVQDCMQEGDAKWMAYSVASGMFTLQSAPPSMVSTAAGPTTGTPVPSTAAEVLFGHLSSFSSLSSLGGCG